MIAAAIATAFHLSFSISQLVSFCQPFAVSLVSTDSGALVRVFLHQLFAELTNFPFFDNKPELLGTLERSFSSPVKTTVTASLSRWQSLLLTWQFFFMFYYGLAIPSHQPEFQPESSCRYPVISWIMDCEWWIMETWKLNIPPNDSRVCELTV